MEIEATPDMPNDVSVGGKLDTGANRLPSMSFLSQT
jgi:hypothetical protein